MHKKTGAIVGSSLVIVYKEIVKGNSTLINISPQYNKFKCLIETLLLFEVLAYYEVKQFKTYLS